uniref:Uncharacterized protein n=1 Tax=Romanomermis culicivorax TaxID=13658 RepID=A0A915I1Y2_ROMCU
MHIKFVYLVELRPEEHLETGYIYDEALLPQVATETWAGVKVVADAVQQMNDIMARRLQKYFQGAPHRQGNTS